MRGWLLVSVAFVGCSPFDGLERDRAAELSTLAARPPAERAPELRDRLLRDALNARIRSVKAYAESRDPVVESLVSRLPLTLAEDYLALGEALAAAGDRDGALAAYQDALVVTARAGRDPAHAPVRLAALRGAAATWRSLGGQEERGAAATILADADASHPAPGDWLAFVVTAVLRTDLPSFKRLASALVLAGANAGSVESFVGTEVGGKAAALAAEALELLRSGAPLRLLDPLAARLAALAPPPPPPPPPPPAPPDATDPARTRSAAPSTPPPAPPSAAAPTPAAKEDVAARLKKLDELHRQKVVTDAEYLRERARILKEAL